MIYSYAARGFNGQLIHVECSIRCGIPTTDIVGLPDGAVKEARERVRAVLHHCGYLYPSERILINLAPAGLRKSGAAFDLPIALAILLHSQQLPASLDELPRLLVLGELELSGKVRNIDGVLAAVASAHELGVRHFLIPSANEQEARSLGLGQVFPLENIAELPQKISALTSCLTENRERNEGGSAPELEPREQHELASQACSLSKSQKKRPAEQETALLEAQQQQWIQEQGDFIDFADVKGQPILKRAVEIALVGRHNILIFGPPGCGKTMVVRSVPSLLLPLSSAEAIESTRIWSQAGLLSEDQALFRYPPVRMPHHSASLEGLVGGGPQLSPGEVSLAHNGLLFLDEAPEFKASHLQGLRQPLENQRIIISRAGKTYWYPADFQLFMAINPCSCGNLGREESICTCSHANIAKYWKRVGGALLDRIDIRIPVRPTSASCLLESREESSAQVRTRIQRAREMQNLRYAGAQHKAYNSRIPAGQVAHICSIDSASQDLLQLAVKKLGLSSRACHSVLRIARSIADLDTCEMINEECLLEAIQYRRYGDRNIFWGSL